MKGSSNKGQALVEVLLAIFVATMVLVGLISATTIALRNSQQAKNQALATQYAQEAMEKIRASRDQREWDDFKSDCSSDVPPLPNRRIGCVCYKGDDSEELCSNPDINKVKVTVTVTWNDHRTELVSFLTKWEQ